MPDRYPQPTPEQIESVRATLRAAIDAGNGNVLGTLSDEQTAVIRSLYYLPREDEAEGLLREAKAHAANCGLAVSVFDGWRFFKSRATREWRDDRDEQANRARTAREAFGGVRQRRRPAPLPAPAGALTPDEALDFFNKRFAVTKVGAGLTKTVVFVREDETFMRPNDFRAMYSNIAVITGDKTHSAADWWATHPDRQDYKLGMDYSPGTPTRDQVLNLWKGFAYPLEGLDEYALAENAPIPEGSWDLLRDHTFKVVCDSDQSLYDYIMGWTGFCYQHRDERPNTSIVLRGFEGAGKSLWMRAISNPFGRHVLTTSDPRELSGGFNARLFGKSIVMAEEAYFAGDPRHRGPLYDLIDGDTIGIERKGIDKFSTTNRLRVLMATNETWAVPVTPGGGRRFCVTNVSREWARHGGSHTEEECAAYFRSIIDQLKAPDRQGNPNSGYRRLLFDMLRYDLSGFDITKIPHTEALDEQRVASLRGFDAWWYDCLVRGFVYETRYGHHQEFSVWHDKISTQLLNKSFEAWASKSVNSHRNQTGGNDLSTWGKEAFSNSLSPNIRLVGENPNSVETASCRGKYVENLDEARARFLLRLNLTSLRDPWGTANERTMPGDDPVSPSDEDLPF